MRRNLLVNVIKYTRATDLFYPRAISLTDHYLLSRDCALKKQRFFPPEKSETETQGISRDLESSQHQALLDRIQRHPRINNIRQQGHLV